MRIFEKDNKHNFVDENNVYIGYDSGQSCCEYADWFISDEAFTTTPEFLRNSGVASESLKPKILDGWVFDIDFFNEVNINDPESCSMAVFRIIKGEEQKFLHLFNCHNGYHSVPPTGHGFKMDFTDKKGLETFSDKKPVREGNL
jgi:hypothetical protein